LGAAFTVGWLTNSVFSSLTGKKTETEKVNDLPVPPASSNNANAKMESRLDERLEKQLPASGDVVTAPVVDETVARKPVKEYTEFVNQPTVKAAPKEETQYMHQYVQEEPIKLKEQPIQVVEDKTILKQQPILHKQQEIQVQKEKPIEIVKSKTEVQTLPEIVDKTTVVQPVRSADNTMKTVEHESQSGRTTTNVQVTAPSQQADQIAGSNLVEKDHPNFVDKVKVKAHNAMEHAREKAREVFHKDDKTYEQSSATSSSIPVAGEPATGYDSTSTGFRQ